MVGSTKDVLIIGGLVAIAFIAYKGIGGFLNNFKIPELPQLPSINISNPFTQSNPVQTTFPNASNNDAALLQQIQSMNLAQQSQNTVLALLAKLTPLGSAANPANAPTAPTGIDVILNDPNLTQAQKDAYLAILNPVLPNSGQTNDFAPPVGKSPYSGKESDRWKYDAGLIDQWGRPITKTGATSVTAATYPTAATQRAATIMPQIIAPIANIINSLLPTSQQFQVFNAAGDVETIGTIRENPIDTLSEVLKYYPNLSASQAADFLNVHSGLLPSQVGFIDGDIKNIMANIDGVNVQVDNYGITDLKTQEMIAAQFTCKEYGLNCDIAKGLLA